eukprot:TRINITY_DN12116_c0_g1_i1.p1 TRINITY_DN12116_c0_g1~~TRINITY_DN12116_c0_g1_i1.p1  ORF type:complete len:2177 (+),score=496.16 TRINITY_DN12116_c0_g1_i1:94-6624(+)
MLQGVGRSLFRGPARRHGHCDPQTVAESAQASAEAGVAEQAGVLPVGTRVDARYLLGSGRITTRYYPGRVVGRNDDGSYQVDYDDGDKWYNVPQELVVRSGTVPPAASGTPSSAQGQAEAKKSAVQQALRAATLDLAQRLCCRWPSSLTVGDQVWARRPGAERWEEGRLLALPSPLANPPDQSGSGAGAENVTEGCGYQVCWRDGRQTSWTKPCDVLKAAAGGRSTMTATVGLFTEVAKGDACDQAALARHLSRGADLTAADGSGSPALLIAVRTGASTEVLSQLIEAGACLEGSGPGGVTSLEQARGIMKQAEAGSSQALAAQKAEELLLSRGASEMPGGRPPEEQLRFLRDMLGRKMLVPLLTSHSAGAMPTELLEAIQLLLQTLDLQVLFECLKPASVRALSGLLQNFVGGADGVKTALLGCRVCRALLSRGEEGLVRMIQSHGILRWARWLASRKPTGPAPTPPRGGSSLSSLLGHQQQQHQQQLQQRAATEELAVEAGLLAQELVAAAGGEDWLPSGDLAETLAVVGRSGDLAAEADEATLKALQRLCAYLEMDGDMAPEGDAAKLLATDHCTAYALEKLDLAGQLLRFLKHSPRCGDEAADRRPALDPERWECLRKVLASGAPGGFKQLVRVLHAIIDTGETFPVWHHKRERGLRALTEPVNVKLRHLAGLSSSPKRAMPAGKLQYSVPAEPLVPLRELRRYLLRVTPVADQGYLSYCHEIVGAVIQERGTNGDLEEGMVMDFEVLLGEIPLPIHSIQRRDGSAQRVLLAMRDHELSRPAPAEGRSAAGLVELQVALCKLQVTAGCTAYATIVKRLRKSLEEAPGDECQEAEETPSLSPEAESLQQSLAVEVTKNVDVSRKVLDEEVERIAGAASGCPQRGSQNNASDNSVQPHMRAHTVSIVASEEVPFELMWPMVRDDILGTVREVCPRASFCSEAAMQAGVQQNGIGPLAERLTLEEAEMLSARLGMIVQTAVSVDQAAVQELKREREKQSEGELVALGARVQFQATSGSSWTPGVVVGHGPAQPGSASPPAPASGGGGGGGGGGRNGAQGAQPGRPCDVIDDQGILWERVPPARVHATQPPQQQQQQSGAQAGSGPPVPISRRDAPPPDLSGAPPGRASAELNSRREGLFAELMRLRERLRFRREEEDEPERDEEQDQEEDEEEDDDDEDESEQPPVAMLGGGGGVGGGSFASAMAAAVAAAESSQSSPRGAAAAAAAMAAMAGAGIGGPPRPPPPEPGAASPAAGAGLGGLSGAVAALAPPRPPSPPLVAGPPGAPAHRPDEELRVLERLRALEQILPEEFLAGPMANLQIRRGSADGFLEIRRIFGGSLEAGGLGGGGGGRSRSSNGAPKPPPLRAELPAFVRAADMTSPSVSLDHPVAERLGAADLEQVDEEIQPESPGRSSGSTAMSCSPEKAPGGRRPLPQLALRLCMLPTQQAADTEGTQVTEAPPHPMRELPEAWNLMKAVHHLQEQPGLAGEQTASTSTRKALVENWNLGYSFVWTGDSTSPITCVSEAADMEVDEEGTSRCRVLSEEPRPESAAKSPVPKDSSAGVPQSSPPATPARKRRRTARSAASSVVARELYPSIAEALSSSCLAGDNPGVASALELLRLLQAHCEELAGDASLWTSVKLDKKLQVQLEDALSVVSGTLPPWATTLPRLCPFLLSLEARKKLLKYTAFGPSFAIHWTQEIKVGSLMQRRATVQTELNAQTDPRKMQELSQELSNLEEHVVRSSNWLGTLQSTLVKVSKGDLLLRQAEVAMELLSGSGHLLEVQFDGETGFGSAVTQSFYVEVSLALQDRELNRQTPLWVEDDGSSCTPYLLSRHGLLIRPLPEGPQRDAACQRFRFLGRLMGHALREGFIVPLPLAEEFFSLVLGEALGAASLPRPGAGLAGELLGALADFFEELSRGEREGLGASWRNEQVSKPDFTSRYLSAEGRSGSLTSSQDESSSPAQQLSLDDYLKLVGVCFLETGLGGASLCPGGENVALTAENLGDFLEKVSGFWFDTGVRAQVDAFRSGLNEILPVECLAAFRPSELRQMFCGEDRVEWDERALLAHLRPAGGLSGGSQLFSHLVAVLLEMDQADRARFLDFVSSCPRLPPGGIANFHLDVFPDPSTRKGFPRSRACANQLYLPPYSSKEELRERLVEAMHCSSGHHEQKMRDS